MMVRAIEKFLAALLLASRWLMAPLYLGLMAGLGVVVVAFFRELAHVIASFAGLGGRDVILAVLRLIDLVLLGNLILIMIGAAFDTIVTSAVTQQRIQRPQWMGKIDFAALKLKVVTAIAAIAGVDLLETFFRIETMDKSTVLLSVLVFLAFVAAGVLLAWMDWLSGTEQ